MAPQVEVEPKGRLAVMVRLVVLAAAVLVVIGVAGRYLEWPLLTTTLGPTLYVFLAHPASETARWRSAVVGHCVAIATGLAALAAFGLWNYPAVTTVGYPSLRQAAASGLAVGVTLAILHLAKSHHAPAAATVLLITTGLSHPGKPLFGLLIGLGAVIASGPFLGRVPLGRPQIRKEMEGST